MSTIPMQQDDHPAYNMPGPTEQYAGDVISLPPPTGPGRGQSIDAPAYATGKAKDPQVLSIGMPTIKAWADRKK